MGLEWLISEDINSGSGDDQTDDEAEDDIPPATWLYLTMPSIQGLKKLLAQWKLYKLKKDPTPGYKELWRIFDYLKDLRVWSAKDRIDPSIDKYVRAILKNQPDREVLVEIDLWYRSERQRRDAAVSTLRAMVTSVQGEVLDYVEIPEIRYQGALVRVSAQVARRLVDGEGGLVSLDEIMTIRPQSEYSTVVTPSEAPTLPKLEKATPSTKRRIAALLDGYPVAAHVALAGRLTVHEVEVTAAQAPVSGRYHGTAMASLILHGDLHAPQKPLDHHLVVIPVLTPAANGGESTPSGKLPIGVIYKSLKAIVKSKDPNLKDLAIINHSLCDTYAPFVQRPSPWAALLDYFSHEHRLLFIVSAGNVWNTFEVGEFANLNEFTAADPLEQEAALLNGLERAKGSRTLLSPAESINSITVGALHADAAPPHTPAVIDPFPNVGMTSLASAVGLGVNRSLKPDLVEQGGRFAAGCANVAGGGIEVHANPTAELGHLVAAPSPTTGDLKHVMRLAGTSNAAALTTRTLLGVADAIHEVFDADGVDWLTLKTRIPILKALLAHGCSWGKIGDVLEGAYPPEGPSSWSARRQTISRFLGYGRPDPLRVVTGAHNRVTLLAEDTIQPDARHTYEIPLPASMLSTRELRAITVTLAWTTPVVFTSADYRGVALKLVDATGKKDFWDGVSRTNVLQPNSSTAEHGTLIHFILDGKKLIKAVSGDRITLHVQAVMRHSSQAHAEVPYALAVTMEMAQALKSELYSQVQQAIVRSRTRARVQ